MRNQNDIRRDRHGMVTIGVALALLFALWCASFDAYQPGPGLGVEADATQFSAMRAVEQLGQLLRESVPHPMGSPANRVVRERILARLRQLGYEPELQPATFGCDLYAVCGTPVNIVARLGTAAETTASGVLLSVHYDSVPAGPGASDDGAGVAEALEIARILKLRPPPIHPIVLLIADGEELGLLGSQVFVDHHPWAAGIKAAVNIDNRGTSGPALMFETGSANAWLMDIYARYISHRRPIHSITRPTSSFRTIQTSRFTSRRVGRVLTLPSSAMWRATTRPTTTRRTPIHAAFSSKATPHSPPFGDLRTAISITRPPGMPCISTCSDTRCSVRRTRSYSRRRS
jgi:hypothetical protein